MKNLKHILLIAFILSLGINYAGYSAEFTDNFTKDFNTFSNEFQDGKENPDSVKNQVKKAKNKDKDKKKKDIDEKEPHFTELNVKSDYINYNAETKEIEAIGHASIILPSDGSTLKADKLILNQDTGILKGYGDVKLLNGINVMEGSFITVNLNEKNALMENPVSENMFIKLNAENAQLISGKDILLENGVAVSKENRRLTFGTSTFSNYGTSQLNEAQKVFYLKENYDEKYTLKTKEIIIDARGEHDTVTIKNAEVYLKDMKLATVGTVKLITNKQQQFVETNIPEIGFLRQFGTYVGPGFAFGGPFDGAIKVAPLFNVYKGNVGVGALARYRNSKNLTEFAISSANDTKTVLRGTQDLTDSLKINYGMNGYMDEWFMGDRVPGGLAELQYHKRYNVEDLGLTFEHRLTGGIARDFNRHYSTTRVRWMGEADKPLFYYGDDIKNRYAVLSFTTQGAASIYGDGNTVGLIRVGPTLRTETDRWIQTIGYLYTAKHGESPFKFDQYRYGTNNLRISEGIKLNKYLSVMWSGSLALNRDAWDNKFLQENRFYVMVGPDDVKFTLGYDIVRQRTVFNCFFALGTQNTEMQFKKLYIKNPDRLGVSEKETKRAERTQLEAKAEIKPSLSDKLFRRNHNVDIEPEREEQILIQEEQITAPEKEYEIIVPKVKEKKPMPKDIGVNPYKKNTGLFRLHDENTTPLLTPMIAPQIPLDI